jgi:putative membrane protein
MKVLKSSSFAVVFVSSVIGAACGSSEQQTPPNTQATAGETNQQYGSTMSQPAPSPDTQTTPAPTGGQGPGRTVESANTSGSVSASNPGSATSAANLAPDQLGSPPADTMGTSTPPATGSTNTARSGRNDDQGSASAVSGFHDADVAAVLRSVNQGEVDEAQLAITKSKSADVRRFAQHMATDHRDMMNKDKALFSRIHVMPSDNVVSNQIKADGRQELSTLQGDTGRDFDRAYMDAQVKGHHHALELIDQMLPNVQNGDFKTAIEGARGKVEHHLQEAEKIQQTVEQGSANKQNGM